MSHTVMFDAVVTLNLDSGPRTLSGTVEFPDIDDEEYEQFLRWKEGGMKEEMPEWMDIGYGEWLGDQLWRAVAKHEFSEALQ